MDFKKHIAEFKDFPKQGIIFRDIMPLFANAELFQQTIITLCAHTNQIPQSDVLVGIESRGFLLATPMAFYLNKPFIAARKKGKLPGDVATETYELEYGHDTIEIQRARITPNTNYVIIDDLLATGGTALATARLIEKNGGRVSGFVFLVELKSLQGQLALKTHFPHASCEILVSYT